MDALELCDFNEESDLKCEWETCHSCGNDYLKSTMSLEEVSNSFAAQYVCGRDDC